MSLTYSKIVKIIDMGIGTRVEIDFVDILGKDEGVLVGDKAEGFFLLLAETRETETYPPRPFRVNAGAIHQYVYVGDNKTKYLSEITSGDRILVTNGSEERLVAVGRVKQEKRPFRKLILENGVSATLQVADSLFIKGESGEVHFLDLKEGDVVACKEEVQVARHKGEILEEEIEEK